MRCKLQNPGTFLGCFQLLGTTNDLQCRRECYLLLASKVERVWHLLDTKFCSSKNFYEQQEQYIVQKESKNFDDSGYYFNAQCRHITNRLNSQSLRHTLRLPLEVASSCLLYYMTNQLSISYLISDWLLDFEKANKNSL